MNCDDHWKAMTFQTPEAIPVSAYIVPAAWMVHREAMDAIVRRHPAVFGEQENARDYDWIHSETYREGEHVDAWGCVWSNARTGMEAIVTKHPVPNREDVCKLRKPDKDTGFPHGFMFLRLTDLRGFEEAMIDFAEEPPELQRLIDIVLEYNLRQGKLRLEKLAGRTEELVGFGDDLGMQTGLPTGPEKWRKYLKPCYRAIYEPFKKAGHYIYMHTDGCVWEIISDLKDCGVDVVNPQFRANGLENLRRVCKGKICVDLDLDRQMFPFCSPKDIDEQIREAVETLGAPEGGLWLQASIGPDVPLKNVEAIAVALETHRHYFSGTTTSSKKNSI